MDKIEEKLFDYLENKLSVEEKARLEAELARNSALRQELEVIQNADSVMRSHQLLVFDDPSFTEGIMALVERKASRVKSGNRLVWMALGIFAAMFALVATFLPVLQNSEAPSSNTLNNLLLDVPSYDFTTFLERMDSPALLQLVIVISAIALLLVADRLLSRKMNTNLHVL